MPEVKLALPVENQATMLATASRTGVLIPLFQPETTVGVSLRADISTRRARAKRRNIVAIQVARVTVKGEKVFLDIF